MKNLLKFPLNIQLFAEDGKETDGGNDNGGSAAETIAKAEYDKLKKSFDDTSHDLAELKKQQKAKLTDDEKNAQDRAEKDKRLQELELQVLTGNMVTELTDTYGKESSLKVIEAYKKGDMVELCKVIATETNALVNTKISETKQAFQQSSQLPPSGKGDKTDTKYDYVKSLVSNKKPDPKGKFWK